MLGGMPPQACWLAPQACCEPLVLHILTICVSGLESWDPWLTAGISRTSQLVLHHTWVHSQHDVVPLLHRR
jgi:hypothetical protein